MIRHFFFLAAASLLLSAGILGSEAEARGFRASYFQFGGSWYMNGGPHGTYVRIGGLPPAGACIVMPPYGFVPPPVVVPPPPVYVGPAYPPPPPYYGYPPPGYYYQYPGCPVRPYRPVLPPPPPCWNPRW